MGFQTLGLSALLALDLGQSPSPSVERPVIQLDEVRIKGKVRGPAIVELQASQLKERIEEIALQSLIKLESKLLELRPRPWHKSPP